MWRYLHFGATFKLAEIEQSMRAKAVADLIQSAKSEGNLRPTGRPLDSFRGPEELPGRPAGRSALFGAPSWRPLCAGLWLSYCARPFSYRISCRRRRQELIFDFGSQFSAKTTSSAAPNKTPPVGVLQWYRLRPIRLEPVWRLCSYV